MEDIDEQILKSIESKFKSCKDIAKELYPEEEVDLRERKVWRRLRWLRKAKFVTFIRSSERYSTRGFPPTLYRKKEVI